MSSLHLLDCVVELLLQLLGLDLSVALLLVLLVEQLLLESFALRVLLLQPGLLLNDELLLSLLHVLLELHLLLAAELFAKAVRLRVFALLHKSLEYLLVLEKARTRLKSEGLVQVSFIRLPELDKLLHVGLLEGFKVCLATFDEVFLVDVPCMLEVANVLLLLLE